MIQPPSTGPMIGAKITAIATSENPFAALRRLERIQDHRLLARLQPAAEQPLQQPEHHKLRQAGRDAAQERAHREHRDADQEIPLAPDQPPQPPGDRHHDAVRHQIGRQRPGRIVIARRQRAGDVRQADVDDRGVQDLHERRQRRRAGHQPDIAPRPPCRIVPIAHAASGETGGTTVPAGSDGASPRWP